MIKYRRWTVRPLIRAILTRHDQTQIDHVNDDDAIGGRARRYPADLPSGDRACVSMRCRADGTRGSNLISHAGEPVVLDITTVGEPDPERGGVSDPGSHSPNSSLPLMRRRATTLAGPQTSVTIDGKRFDVPVKIRSGPFVAHEGYYTEGHSFAAIRAGTMSYRLKARPEWSRRSRVDL